jgi:membrane protein involved in colicin uptake
MRYSIAKTKAEAVALAVKEQIRRAKLKTLADRLGSIEVDEKAIEEGNNADIKRSQWLNGIGVDGDSAMMSQYLPWTSTLKL